MISAESGAVDEVFRVDWFMLASGWVIIYWIIMAAELHYLVILDAADKPLLFKSYRGSEDDLNIQLHCYASIDFLEERIKSRLQEYLGKIYTIYNQTGEYSIYAFYTLTKVKILAVFKELPDNRVISEADIGDFC